MLDAEWLRNLGDEGLAALLRRRPEVLAPPAPMSLTELAERLNTSGSVLTTLRRLDRPTLQVSEAIAALGGRADRAGLDQLFGVADENGGRDRAAAITRAVEILRDSALLETEPTLRLVPAAHAAWPNPLGLGIPAADIMPRYTVDDLRVLARNLGLRPASRKSDILAQVLAALADADRVRRIVAGAPAAAHTMVIHTAVTGETVHDHGYSSPSFSRTEKPVQWAIAHGLLAPSGDWETGLVMPTEVTLALRGPTYVAPIDPVPPVVPRAVVAPEQVAQGSAAAGSAAVRFVAALLDEAGRTPLTTLRSGGFGVREVRRLAKRLGSTEHEVCLALALAGESGLLSIADGRAAPTAGYDRWLRVEPADRLATLLRIWWRLPYVPTLCTGGWAVGEHVPGTVTLRETLLGQAAEPAGNAVTDSAALVALALWRKPYAFGDPGTAPNRGLSCLVEAGILGVITAGVVTASGHGLLDNAADLATALGDIGNTQRTARLQADLTAVVAGTPAPDLAALLDLVADTEARGTACVWRFSPASVRRALDAGHTADALLADLKAVAIGAVPQPLEYLIADVARRHGSVRASAVACCLRGEDTALLAEIAADRRLSTLGLRLLAPTVLASTTPLTETLAALRRAGHAPVAELPDGTTVIERPTTHRTTAPHGAPAGAGTSARGAAPARAGAAARRGRPTGGKPGTEKTPGGTASDQSLALARALLAAPDDAVTGLSPTMPSLRAAMSLSLSERRILAHAIDGGHPVAIVYVDRAGNISSRVIEEVQVSNGALSAWCRLRQDDRWFSLSRILAVELAAIEPLDRTVT